MGLELTQKTNFETRLEQKSWDISEETHIFPECYERLKKEEIELL